MPSARQLRQRITAAIAVGALLLAALAPTLTHALAKPGASFPALLDICTVATEHTAAMATPDATDSQPGQESVPTHQHCPFCLPIIERLGLPPAASFSFFNAESGLARPDAQAFLLHVFVPLAALPRGPPAIL